MTDSWERRSLPYTPGYNNPATTLTFAPVYDANTDTLVITASHPVFASLDVIQYQTSQGTGSFSFSSWTVDSPTQITIPSATATFSITPPGDIQQLDFYSPGAVLIGTWVGVVTIGSTIEVTSALEGLGGTYVLQGTGLDTFDLRWRIVDDFSFDKTYYADQLNAPGVTVTVDNDNQVTITDPDLIPAGIAPTLVQTRNSVNSVVHEFYPLTYPHLQSICSPAPDTIRFEGLRFLTASAGAIGYAIPLLADYASGALLNGGNMIVELASPVANWTVVTHTDTVIELSNPDFTNEEPSGGPGDFVVTGAAFHDGIDQTFYYYLEPWGETFSTPVDGAGCGALSITYDSGTDRIVIFDPDADFTSAYGAVVHGDYPVEFYVGTDAFIIDANTIELQWFPGGGVNSQYNVFVGGIEVFPYDGISWYDFPNRIAMYDLTDSEIDLTEGGFAKIRKVSSPADNQIQFDGINFLSDSQGAAFNFDRIAFSGVGAPARVYRNPLGPNSGDTSPGAVIIAWTDTQVIVEDTAIDGVVVGIEDFEDYQGLFIGLSLARENNNTLMNMSNYTAVTIQ